MCRIILSKIKILHGIFGEQKPNMYVYTVDINNKRDVLLEILMEFVQIMFYEIYQIYGEVHFSTRV
jgi:hypothetical protein